MKLLLRIVGIWALIAAIVALAIDGTKSLADGDGLIATPLGEYWQQIHPDSLAGLQAGVEGAVHPVLWDPVMAGLIQSPAWLLFGVLGLLLYWLGRPRRRLEVFSN